MDGATQLVQQPAGAAMQRVIDNGRFHSDRAGYLREGTLEAVRNDDFPEMVSSLLYLHSGYHMRYLNTTNSFREKTRIFEGFCYVDWDRFFGTYFAIVFSSDK